MTTFGTVRGLHKDLIAGVVVFLVALPLCLGIALASGAPLMSGLVAGVIGGILVGWLSGSHTSVTGPAAGLTAIVLTQIDQLGSFEAFLVAVSLAGLIQIGLGLFKAGIIASYFPSNVIKGLLAAIGIIIILKQIPHLVGYDSTPEGHLAFRQEDGDNTLTALLHAFQNLHPGAALIGLLGFGILMYWDKTPMKKSILPSALVVVFLGVILNVLFTAMGGALVVGRSHLVQVPIIKGWEGLKGALYFPDFGILKEPVILVCAVTIAIVASLETLLNLEAVDKLDPKKRKSPANRELFAQGVGNFTAGLCGGLPVTSVIVRGSVNIQAGAQTKVSAIFHGFLLILSVLMLPKVLNMIPLASLAAILVATGCKLAKPGLFKAMWKDGRSQFIPFITTVVAIVFTDLLVGILIGLAVSIFFILRSNLRRPFRLIEERHATHNVTRLELSNQVSFLNKAALTTTLLNLPKGSHVVIDARNTDYVDPDIVDFLHEFEDVVAKTRNYKVSLIGFRDRYTMIDKVLYVDVSTREMQSKLTPARVLRLLKEGNERFVRGERLQRDLVRQVSIRPDDQFPMAVVLSCIDSRMTSELIFDLGLGEIFSIRIVGNVAEQKVLGSIEYACKVAGTKLVVVMGHTHSRAIATACDILQTGQDPAEATGCAHFGAIVDRIRPVVECETHTTQDRSGKNDSFVNRVAHLNVEKVMELIYDRSKTIHDLMDKGEVGLVGAMFDVRSGKVEFIKKMGLDQVFEDKEEVVDVEEAGEPAAAGGKTA